MLNELREQLETEPPRSRLRWLKRRIQNVNVTLPGVMKRLKQQALAEGRSCSSLATFLIEDGLRRHAPLRDTPSIRQVS